MKTVEATIAAVVLLACLHGLDGAGVFLAGEPILNDCHQSPRRCVGQVGKGGVP